MEDGAGRRIFSTQKHRRGQWDTKVVSIRNPVLRGCWNYLSYKRKLVDDLARNSANAALVLEVGCGKGAYSHWFLGRKCSTIIGVDWSFLALSRIAKPRRGTVMPVCADIALLPFKEESFDALFSIDTLGHVPQHRRVLDEILRVARAGAQVAIHSECRDYQQRWPDRRLIKRIGVDMLAQQEGHFSLQLSSELRAAYGRRFIIRLFFSPAGYLGWLTGYPEKYHDAFKASRGAFLAALTAVFALIKKMPFFGLLLRIVNASTNHMEVFLGLSGGGSCFAMLQKPPSSSPLPSPLMSLKGRLCVSDPHMTAAGKHP